MIAVHNFRQAKFRERVTGAILEMLVDLPETQRNTFIWNHYRGYQPKQIADILRCSPSEIEATLDAINSILYQRTHSLLVEDPQLDTEMDLPAASSRKAKVALQPSVLGPSAARCLGSLRWSAGGALSRAAPR
jgi:DNA-directed RNA polymerase specialized sigma24 family protein